VPLLWGLSVVLGILLSVFLPWVVLRGEKRCLSDWLWAAAVGAATGLSIWVSILVFLAWNRRRFPGETRGRIGRVLEWILLILGASGIFLVLIFVAVTLLEVRKAEYWLIPGGIGAMFLVVCFPIGLICLLARIGNWTRAAWFALFMLAHGGLACLVFFGLWKWLAGYV
jgi:hypothetical protein